MNDWTPGPWTVDHLGKVRSSVDGGKGFIADPGDGRYYNSIPRDAAISLANARLIAAAPDLAEALESFAALADEIERMATENGSSPDAWAKSVEWEDLCKARAALAKARGEG
jgi:hypothetical protein